MKWRAALLFLFTVATTSMASAANVTRMPVVLEFDGHHYQLDLYASAGAEAESRPGIVLVPEYWGKEQLAEAPARELASKGYVVLVVDLYGEGRSTKTSEDADKLVETAEAKGIDNVIEVVSHAVEHLKQREGVDRERIGAVGFGYGGGLVYNFAKRGNSGLSAAVSFYGGTKKLRETSGVGRLPALLYVRPENDVYTSPEEFASFKTELGKSRFHFEIVPVESAHYGFIHKGIETYGGEEGNTFMYFDQDRAAFAWGKAYAFLEKNLNSRAK